MQRQSISSGTIKSIGYDPDRQILEIEFQSGAVDRYHEVPVDVVDDLLSAGSPGQFFNREIRNRFPYRKIKTH
jgi:hypothetical protein